MIYGIIFGTIGLISFIYTNNKLQKKYYYESTDKKDDRKIHNNKTRLLNKNLSWFPLSRYNTKYTKLQKIHYFFSMLMFILFNGIQLLCSK